jgi:predicted O-linked N-acetylglucosamine transferase (SPINDLY family)
MSNVMHHQPIPSSTGVPSSELRAFVGATLAQSQEADTLVIAALRQLESGDVGACIGQCRQALLVSPSHYEALHVLAQAHLIQGELEDCLMVTTKILALHPNDAVALNNMGVALDGMNRLEEAIAAYTKSSQIDPRFGDPIQNRALALDKLGQHAAAEKVFRELIELFPDNAEAYYGLGNALCSQKRVPEAVEAFRSAVKIQPDYGLAWFNLGNALLDQKLWDEAIEAYGYSSNNLPYHAATYSNCGNAYTAKHMHEEAQELYDAAVACNPKFFEAYFNKAVLYNLNGRFLQAIEACHKVIQINPDHPKVMNALGVALAGIKHHVAAIDAFEKAVEQNPKQVEAWSNMAGSYEILQKHEDAVRCCKEAMKLDPDYPNLRARMAFKQLYICDWSDSNETLNTLLSRLEHGTACDPFRYVAFSQDAKLHHKIALGWAKSLEKPLINLDPPRVPPIHQRIRIGYFSADFHLHATALLAARMFELHDKDRFETYAFSFGPDRKDEMFHRLNRSFDHWIDIRAMDDMSVVKKARELEIDIAVDLKGYTLDHRIGIFQLRPAPIQISYLGFPGTTGCSFMDYIVADRTIIPPPLRKFYTEKVIYLPHSYQINDNTKQVPNRRPSRARLGLPNQGFVFCCFNNNYKITPEVFDVWMRLLKKVPGSVLWLLKDNELAEKNLRLEAAKRGVSPERLIFAARTSAPAHLARQRAADLFLDTLPCNAHTTASDALLVGLPVLTCMGESFASRVAASLLRAQGLDELVTASLEEYETRALQLATSPAALRRLRTRCKSSIKNGHLFNSHETTVAIEKAYISAYNNLHEMKAPKNISIKSVIN